MKRRQIPIMLILTFVVLQLYLFLYGCSIPTEQSQKTRPPSLYSSKCGSCHRLIEPHKHDLATWQHYVNKYGKGLTVDEKQLLMDYLAEQSDPVEKQLKY